MRDPTTYKRIVESYSDMVFRIAINQMRNRADAEDVTQSIFLKAYLKAPEGIGDEEIKRWLIRVTINECKSILRSVWHKRVDLKDALSPDHSETQEENYEALQEALDSLSKKSRIVVHLFYFEGYSTAEIAEILDIKEDAVRTRLTRARKLLKTKLEEVGYGRLEEVPADDGTGARLRRALG